MSTAGSGRRLAPIGSVHSSCPRSVGVDRGRENRPKILLFEQLGDKAAIGVAKGGERIAAVVDLGGEVGLVKAAVEGRMQIQNSIPVVAGQRQAEPRQPFVQLGRVNLIPLRLNG